MSVSISISELCRGTISANLTSSDSTACLASSCSNFSNVLRIRVCLGVCFFSLPVFQQTEPVSFSDIIGFGCLEKAIDIVDGVTMFINQKVSRWGTVDRSDVFRLLLDSITKNFLCACFLCVCVRLIEEVDDSYHIFVISRCPERWQMRRSSSKVVKVVLCLLSCCWGKSVI